MNPDVIRRYGVPAAARDRPDVSSGPPVAKAQRSGPPGGVVPRTRLVTGQQENSGRTRMLLGAGGAAILLHGLLTALLIKAPDLLPLLSRSGARHPEPPPTPTIEMVMDDNRYSGGGKPAPTPAPQAGAAPTAASRSSELPRQQATSADAPTVPPPEEASQRPMSAPPTPDLRAAEVELDPSSGLGYGHQDDPLIIPAKPDNKRANKMPVYPVAAGRRGEEGAVQMLVMIGADGSVMSTDIAVSSGHPDLDRTARDAVSHWHFRPAMQNGRAVPTQLMQTFNFVIDRNR